MNAPRPIPDSLRLPVVDAASALAWLESLHRADMVLHLDDSPETVIDGSRDCALFRPEDCDTIRDRVAAVRAVPDLSGLNLSAGEASAHYDAFAFLAYLEACDDDTGDDGNNVAGCLPGIRLDYEGAGFILLDCMRGPDWTWGERGRYSLHTATGDAADPVGDLLGEYDTPEAAGRAFPAFAAMMREQSRASLEKAAEYWRDSTAPEAEQHRARIAAEIVGLDS